SSFLESVFSKCSVNLFKSIDFSIGSIDALTSLFFFEVEIRAFWFSNGTMITFAGRAFDRARRFRPCKDSDLSNVAMFTVNENLLQKKQRRQGQQVAFPPR
ncbi:hypothetical protein EGW08_000523, partial [Elysia chlorotica]